MCVSEREKGFVLDYTHTFHAYNFNALFSFKYVCFACWLLFENLSTEGRGVCVTENEVGDGLLVLFIDLPLRIIMF